MRRTSRRETTRSRPWPDTRATVKLPDPMSTDRQKSLRITGRVADIGSTGLFLVTEDYAPVHKKAKIRINFGHDAYMAVPSITAMGEIVRRTAGGIGIRFTSINLSRLQECIISRMNLRKIPVGQYNLRLSSCPTDMGENGSPL